MKRKIPLLRGIAILTVVLAHACARAAEAFESQVRGDVPFDTSSWLQYNLLIGVVQLGAYAVPAFLFVSGLFVPFAVQGTSLERDWKAIRGQLVTLARPFLVWSVVAVCVDVALGISSPRAYIRNCLMSGQVEWGYYFVPLLAQCYLLSIFIVRWMAARPGLVLVIAAGVQFISVGLREFGGLWLGWDSIIGLGAKYGDYFATRWIFYFVLGLWASSRTTQIAIWLKSRRSLLGCLMLVFGVLSASEGILLNEAQHKLEWALSQQRLLVTVYAICALGFYFSLDLPRSSRVVRSIENAGTVSLALYLIHPIFHKGLSRVLLHFTPTLVAHYAWTSALIYFVVGLCVIWFVTRLARQSSVGPLARRFLGL